MTFIFASLLCNLIYKPILFAITAIALLAAIVTVTLYTANASYAQGNATNATSGALKNMSNATSNAIKGGIIRNAIPPI
jgi:hypothetical protein